MTITPDDILKSSVFAEDHEPEDDERADLGVATMSRSIILGVVGDSAAGKTTLTRGLVRVLGEDNVTVDVFNFVVFALTRAPACKAMERSEICC